MCSIYETNHISIYETNHIITMKSKFLKTIACVNHERLAIKEFANKGSLEANLWYVESCGPYIVSVKDFFWLHSTQEIISLPERMAAYDFLPNLMWFMEWMQWRQVWGKDLLIVEEGLMNKSRAKWIKEVTALLVQAPMDETLILASKKTSFMLGSRAGTR